MSEKKTSPFRTLQNLWEQTSVPARFSVAVFGVVSIAMLAGIAYWSMQPHYVPLANSLDPQKAAEVVNLLDTEGIANKRNFSGTGILVDQKKWNKANALISSVVDPGNVESNPMSPMLTDPTTKDHRIARDLEMRLEQTISLSPSIESARVHLGIPEPTPFVRDQREKTASITVQMRPGHPLTRKISESIVDKLSGSVEGLRRENVNVSDTAGNTHQYTEESTGIVAAQLESRRREEYELTEKVQSLLDSMLGVGKAIVQLTVEMDFTKIELKEIRFDPKLKVASKEESKTTKGSHKNPRGIGATGTAGNLGGGSGRRNKDELVYQDETSTTEYHVSETTETKTQQPGQTKRLTIAVMVELPSEKEGDSAKDAAAPNDTKKEIEDLIKSAVGFNELRNDQITVSVVDKLVGTEAALELPEVPTSVQTWTPYIRNGSLGIAALVALVLGLLTLKRIKPVVVATSGNERSMTPKRARQLSELSLLARKNPEVLSNILNAWVGSEDSSEEGQASNIARSAA